MKKIEGWIDEKYKKAKSNEEKIKWLKKKENKRKIKKMEGWIKDDK